MLLVLKSCWFLESSTVSLAFLLWISQEILARIFAQWVWSLVCLTQNYFFGCIFLGKIGNSHRKPEAFVIQSLNHVWLCDIMDCTTPGFPVHHQFPELAQTHVHRVSDAIQPSHPLSSPSPPAPNPSQHQSLFQWVNSSHEVAKILSFSFSIKILKHILKSLLPSSVGWGQLLNSLP